MSQVEKGNAFSLLGKLREENIETGLTFSVSRQDFLNPKSDLEEALKILAKNPMVKGYALVMLENGKILLQIFQDSKDTENLSLARANSTLCALSLEMKNINNKWLEIHGRPFEDVEQEFRQTLATQNPDSLLLAIFEFTD